MWGCRDHLSCSRSINAYTKSGKYFKSITSRQLRKCKSFSHHFVYFNVGFSSFLCDFSIFKESDEPSEFSSKLCRFGKFQTFNSVACSTYSHAHTHTQTNIDTGRTILPQFWLSDIFVKEFINSVFLKMLLFAQQKPWLFILSCFRCRTI